MYLIIIFTPLIASILSISLGRKIGKNGASLLTTLGIFICWLISLLIFYEVTLSHSICLIKLFRWIDVGYLHIYWEFLFDTLTSVMLLVILSISLCVHLYSIEYMYSDPHLCRFMSYLSLFTFFMLILVTAGNFLQLFFGWEGVGVCSYLLINFWYTRILANKAAMKALIINKIGDVILLFGIILFFSLYYSLDIGFVNCSTWLIKKEIIVYVRLFWINFDYLTLIMFFFILGASAKSAQIGLHTWLPDAMEGPTPVSALIHAATMVTAGIFLLLRSVYILKYLENCLLLITFIGGITAFISATIGLFQNDIKKVIAYSTCSQLGYMMLSCGLNNYSGSLFHLMNHAFFKALLFLSAGAIIHSMLDQQDMRKMGKLLKYLPLSHFMILIGSLTIMGIPFLTGYYSKDFILENIYCSETFLNFFVYWLGVISAGLTSIYSVKLVYLTFYNTHNSYFKMYWQDGKSISINESNWLVIISLILLFIGSVFIGFILKDMFIGIGTDIWLNTLETENYKDTLKILKLEFLPIGIKLIPIILTILSSILGYWYLRNNIRLFNYVLNSVEKKEKKNKKNIILNLIKMTKIFIKGYYFNNTYNNYFYKYRNLSSILFKEIDKGIIENLGPMSIVKIVNKIMPLVSKKNKGLIDYYVFVMILGLLIILMVIFWLNLILIKLKIFVIILIILMYKKINKC